MSEQLRAVFKLVVTDFLFHATKHKVIEVGPRDRIIVGAVCVCHQLPQLLRQMSQERIAEMRFLQLEIAAQSKLDSALQQ
jgi:hypothetical protein